MVKATKKQQPLTPPTPIQTQPSNVVVLSTTDYTSLVNRLQRLEQYITAFSQTYEIKDNTGTLVIY